MELSKRIRHEHAELRSLAQHILNQPDGAGAREQDFRNYDRQLREHLDLFEAFFVGRLREDPAVRDSIADVKSEHALVRKELKALNRGDKESHQWSAEFRRFTERFEHLCHRHDAIVAHAEASGRGEMLDRQYEQARSRRSRGFLVPAGRGSATAMLVGAAAAAGAAYVLSRSFNRGFPTDRPRRRESWREEGFSPAASAGVRPAFDFPAGGHDAPDTSGDRAAPDPAKAPSASGIIIN